MCIYLPLGSFFQSSSYFVSFNVKFRLVAIPLAKCEGKHRYETCMLRKAHNFGKRGRL